MTQFYFKPNIEIIISGQQSGTPIPLPSHEGTIYLGVTTDLKKDVSLEEVRVEYGTELGLTVRKDLVTNAFWAQTEKGTAKMKILEKIEGESNEIPHRDFGKVVRDTSLNLSHPDALVLSSLPKIRADNIYVYGLDYKSENDEFTLFIKVIAKIEEYEVGPPWNMFSINSHQHTQSISFKIDKELIDESKRLLRYGILLAPGKSMTLGKIS